jgi:hypothetical protein
LPATPFPLGPQHEYEAVTAELARTLERELNALSAQAETLQEENERLRLDCDEQVEQQFERANEWRAQAELQRHATERAEAQLAQVSGWQGEKQVLLAELVQARKDAERYRRSQAVPQGYALVRVTTLSDLRDKLRIYWEQTEGVYGGGIPADQLMKQIDRVLAARPNADK